MTKVIKGGWLFDGSGSLRQGMAVVLEENRVKEVLPIEQLPAEHAMTVIDAEGCTVLPGLIDCHVHITSSGDADSSREAGEPDALLALRGAKNSRTLLKAGFTTVRNMGTRNCIDISIKQAIDRGYVTGPRIITSGQMLTMTGGHGWMSGRQVDGADDARKGAREQLRAGAEVIKIMATGGVMTPGVEPGSPQLTIEEMRAAVEEAHKAGRKTATHAQGTTGIKNAVLAGLDSIEHGIFLDDEVIQMMIDRGVALVPTLVAPYHIVKGGVEAGIPAYAVEKANRVFEAHRASFARALAAGVAIAFGTDCGTPLNRPGSNALELQMMVEYGMSPAQALAAATSVAAQVCDRADQIGSISAGKYADILIVKGNVLDDVKLLQDQQNFVAIIKDGQTV
ncbi:MAG: amidohydrolase family protein [Bacillota bacterium]|jgi:imidazolonepropionase-like amidohydrolase